jgi:hypothetical protein
MLTLQQIMQYVQDGITKEEAALLLTERIEDLVRMGIAREEATRRTLVSIGYFAGYYSHEIADKTYELFNTEHPIWGREHPTPAEALRLGMEHGRRLRERNKGGR